jgi:hypothetical protein
MEIPEIQGAPLLLYALLFVVDRGGQVEQQVIPEQQEPPER